VKNAKEKRFENVCFKKVGTSDEVYQIIMKGEREKRRGRERENTYPTLLSAA